MSSEAVASVFKNLNPGMAALVEEIKEFLEFNEFKNQDDADEHAQIAVETAVYKVRDESGVMWAGPDHRNAIVTQYYSPHENLDETIRVLIGLVFPDDALRKEGSVSITINDFEEYNIPQDCSWDDIKGHILSLMGDCSFEDEATDPPTEDDGTTMPVIEGGDDIPGVDSNATPGINQRKISFCSKIFVREFSQSPEIQPTDYTVDDPVEPDTLLCTCAAVCCCENRATKRQRV